MSSILSLAQGSTLYIVTPVVVVVVAVVVVVVVVATVGAGVFLDRILDEVL